MEEHKRSPIEKSLLEKRFSEANHLLDLVTFSLLPSRKPTKTQLRARAKSIDSAVELHQAGVKFVKSDSSKNKNLLDITFNKEEGILRIPSLTLVRTPKDAEILVLNEVLGLASGEYLSTFWDSLDKNCKWYSGANSLQVENPDDEYDLGFQYIDIVEDLHEYYKNPWHKWKAILKQNYFNSPWAIISIAVAAIILILTIIQTVCSFMGLEKR
ncbi:hypothetical protein OWV82_003226 [Melia azedarach]|uniref:Uncharacterized protein n=1 Tax=Melia azedarach TaxID=155640 RepID=A0ACC1YLZ6_MELAZ|nr:hypothetical protein OWV82_003226 [Melia azedarach]